MNRLYFYTVVHADDPESNREESVSEAGVLAGKFGSSVGGILLDPDFRSMSIVVGLTERTYTVTDMKEPA